MIRNNINCLFILLFVSSLTMAQNTSSSIRKKNIRQVEQKLFDYKDGMETFVRWSLDEYDNKGRIITEKELNADSTFKVYETFKYDKKNRVILHSEFDKLGKLKRKTVTDFDNMNDRKEEQVFNSNNEMIELTRFTYDSFGLKTQEITYKPNGFTVTKRIAYKYDSKGSMIERKVFNDREELIQIRNYKIKYN